MNSRKKYQFPTSTLLFCALMPVYMELCLHGFVYRSFSVRIVYPLLFALAAGSLLFLLTTAFPQRVNRILGIVLTSIIVLYFEVQFVYNSIFGEFMSVWQVSFGAEAITNFYQQLFYGIVKVAVPILVLLLPVPVVAVFSAKGRISFRRQPWIVPAAALLGSLMFHFGAVGVMAANDHGVFSVYRLYNNVNTATEISTKNIGLLSTTRLECHYLLTGADKTTEQLLSERSDLSSEYDPEHYNVLNVDFAGLAQKTNNSDLMRLDHYFASAEATSKTEYTGIFKDYNLITICAESYSPFLIDETLTPALYKLAHGGFVFENFYGTYGSNTTNGEYTLNMGLYPDLSRSKSTASFYASQKNYLPFCLGNEMQQQGALTYAYHNYSGEYYSRDVTHPNMGYVFKSATDGLDMELSWPASDLEMMHKSVGDYLYSGKQFCTYYMTFSGHYQYNWDNPMSAKNRAAVDSLPYSDTVKAYISCNLELEYALEYLMDELEKAGVADKTVIVLTNDHYPYGLTEQEYNELAGRPVDPVLEKFRSSFICYAPGMSVPVDTYCSTVDILPTLLNLFGLPYDSRLLAGRDVLSPEAYDTAVLSDQSFITRDFALDASTGTVRRGENAPADTEQRVSDIQKRIAQDMQASIEILNSDYYAHALLGLQDADNTLQEYLYTDIPESFSLGMLDYFCENGYMDPFSETLFGFDLKCAYAEMLEALYRIEGRPSVEGAAVFQYAYSTRSLTGKYQAAARWAQDNGLISEFISMMDSFTVVTRRSASLTMMRYAQHKGVDVSVDEQEVLKWSVRYPNLAWDEIRAMLWCFDSSIARLDGSLESIFKIADQQMTRYYIMSMIYVYSLQYS